MRVFYFDTSFVHESDLILLLLGLMFDGISISFLTGKEMLARGFPL
jgi:hypothetical protein